MRPRLESAFRVPGVPGAALAVARRDLHNVPRRKPMRHAMTVAVMVFLATGMRFAHSQEPKTAAQEKGQTATRTEHDLLGEKQIPNDVYWGVQTARALENFQISGFRMNTFPEFVQAYAIVKLAAARANTQVGKMKPERLAAIEKAYAAIMDGKFNHQFLVDWYQGGAGTSANMNMNEVMANVGLELIGHAKGEYQYLEPHDDL